MIDTKALRQKILDLAIRGKLVPQDPDDEPASVLLERIRQQKQQMVKEGKLKPKDIKNDSVIFVGEDNLHYEKFSNGSVKCIEDEIPFDIPGSWAWVRISSICVINPKNDLNDDTEVSFIPMPHICEGYENRHSFDIRKWSEIKTGYTHFAENDIGIAKITPCFENRKSVVFHNLKNGAGAGTTELFILRPIISVEPDYLLWIAKTDDFINGGVETFSAAVGQQRVDRDFIVNYLIPLPPVNEQKSIINKINVAFSVINTVDQNKADLANTIFYAKSKILDLAIRGQLVPQNPDDEPASVLLERIRAEKEELIKQGKLKRDKKESVIFRGEDNSYYEKMGTEVYCIDEEIPFDIPDTWEWMRLESCCIKEIRRGKSPKYIDESGTLVFAQKCNTRYSGIDVGLALFLDKNTLGRYPDDEYMQDGDVVINSTGTGTLGRVGIYHATDNYLGLPIVPDSHVTIIRAARSIQSVYLYGFMKANQSELEKEGEGSTNQKELKPLTLKEMLIPIPPYSEQERIVATITAAFSTISAIENSLN